MDLKREVEKLRENYVSSRPHARLKLIDESIQEPAALPNKLVTRVAAIEGLIRSLLMSTHASSKAELWEIYPKFRTKKVQAMIRAYLKRKGRKPPGEEFGKESWDTFEIAVEYRNLLVHECIFLGKRKYDPLENACETVYEKLVKISKIQRKKA